MTTEPLHVAIVNGKQLRFFRSPNNDGRADFPWHSTDDLQSVFGLNRAQCRIMTTMWWNGSLRRRLPYRRNFRRTCDDCASLCCSSRNILAG
jgi:hypothetical protein